MVLIQYYKEDVVSSVVGNGFTPFPLQQVPGEPMPPSSLSYLSSFCMTD
jgi:hypothetical protein